jgi:hypothetical protein
VFRLNNDAYTKLLTAAKLNLSEPAEGPAQAPTDGRTPHTAIYPILSRRSVQSTNAHTLPSTEYGRTHASLPPMLLLVSRARGPPPVNAAASRARPQPAPPQQLEIPPPTCSSGHAAAAIPADADHQTAAPRLGERRRKGAADSCAELLVRGVNEVMVEKSFFLVRAGRTGKSTNRYLTWGWHTL